MHTDPGSNYGGVRFERRCRSVFITVLLIPMRSVVNTFGNERNNDNENKYNRSSRLPERNRNPRPWPTRAATPPSPGLGARATLLHDSVGAYQNFRFDADFAVMPHVPSPRYTDLAIDDPTAIIIFFFYGSLRTCAVSFEAGGLRNVLPAPWKSRFGNPRSRFSSLLRCYGTASAGLCES
jgi:hypothetical protein